MKMFFIVFVLLNGLSLGYSADTDLSQHGSISSPSFIEGVRKINDNLYEGQKEPGLFFVMERIDKNVPQSNFEFWRDFCTKEESSYEEYRKMYADRFTPKDQFHLKFRSRSHHLNDGLPSFVSSLNYSTDNELWIAYAYVTDKDAKTAKGAGAKGGLVEMAVPVMTHQDAPMVTHMGITRSFGYMLKASRNKDIPIHKNLSKDLHSFAAKVILMRDPKKLYMITAPVPVMLNILQEALPKQSYVGDNITLAKKAYEDDLDKQMERLDDMWEKEIKPLRGKDKDAHAKRDKEYVERYDAVQAKKNNLESVYYGYKTDPDFDRILKDMKPGREDSPIMRSQDRKHFTILDKERKNIIFKHDRDQRVIHLWGKTLTGDETKRFDWFYHPDMIMNPFLTVDLEALASLGVLIK